MTTPLVPAIDVTVRSYVGDGLVTVTLVNGPEDRRMFVTLNRTELDHFIATLNAAWDAQHIPPRGINPNDEKIKYYD